jgi:ketosteroid isomerase-like protein
MKNLTSGHMSRRRVFASGSLVLAGPLLSTAYAQAVNESPKPAPGKNPPADIQALIESHVKAFNTHNTQLFMSVFSDTAVIIDGIPPYRWLNPNAPANWLADVDKWREKFGVTSERISYEMGFWNVEDSDAYAVIAGTLAVTIKGQTVDRTGTLAYTFSKRRELWKIDAQGWGRTS